MDKQFTRQPVNGTARAGQPYALSCEVPSAPPASVSWLRDGETLPHDDRQPLNGKARAGQPYALSCEVPLAPPASVSWLRDGESLPHDDRYIFLANQLLFTQIRKEDAGVYKCVATNTYLNKNRISDSAWLRVEDPVDEEPALLQLRDEVNITAPRYSRVRLLCPVTGWPRPKITWEIPDSSGRRAILDYTEEILDLTSLELDLEGVYKCSVDEYTHIHKIFNVTVTEAVTITLPPVSKEVIRASTVRFNCTAVGRPTPTVTWYKDGQPLVLGGRFNMRSANFGSRYELVVGGVTSADAGIYQCFASSADSIASGWAALGVGGASAAAPTGVRCWPLGAHAVLVRWEEPMGDVMAYTVQTTLPAWPGQPHSNTEETITVSEPLTPYGFQVRAFIKGPGKNVASDMSEPPIFCQGQGVPIQIRKKGDDAVLISWQEFAKETPDVAQWVLQYRPENSTEERNITLSGDVRNYTLPVPPDQNLQVRLLGSKTLEWLPQNLTLLPWTSTASRDDAGDVSAVPQDVHVTGVWAREFAVRWRCERCEGHAFTVCVRKPDGTNKCLDSYNNSATVDGLEPETEYEVEVQARLPGRAVGGPFSLPQTVTTLSDGPQLVKDLTWRFVNATTVRVSWNAPPAKYTVSYSSELKMPVEMWSSLDTVGNTALITDIDPTRDTFVMVTSFDPHVYSPIKTIPAQISEAKDLQSTFTRSGVMVSWKGGGPRVVRYSQNLTHSLDLWPSMNASGSSIEITNLDPTLPTYVMVAAPGQSQRSQVLTIPVRPDEPSSLYLGIQTILQYIELFRQVVCGQFIPRTS
ncbi:hypothetical protein ABMA28_001271 [Loxostege sticticalis]|uniref:Uncharacterized protein n=1 Tax=Loxostege sticticalis TaxID=481309 RepID=A0ABD0T3T7_LOXSC